MKLKKSKVNILGTDYKLQFISPDKDELLLTCCGYCDKYAKRIVVAKQPLLPDGTSNLLDFHNAVLLHELIHAFLQESGLQIDNARMEEEALCDWLVAMLPKINLVYDSCKLEGE